MIILQHYCLHSEKKLFQTSSGRVVFLSRFHNTAPVVYVAYTRPSFCFNQRDNCDGPYLNLSLRERSSRARLYEALRKHERARHRVYPAGARDPSTSGGEGIGLLFAGDAGLDRQQTIADGHFQPVVVDPYRKVKGQRVEVIGLQNNGGVADLKRKNCKKLGFALN